MTMPNNCDECERSYGPHYKGPCEHGGPFDAEGQPLLIADFEDRELCTILAALREYRRLIMSRTIYHNDDTASADGLLEPLSVDEITKLADRIKDELRGLLPGWVAH